MKKQIIIFVISLVLVGTGSFFGGMQYQKSKGSGESKVFKFSNQMTGGQNTTTGRRGAMAFGGNINGTILSKDDKSITVKLRNGGSQIVFLSDSTSILKSDKAEVSDLAIDSNVVVMGKANSDGSIEAQSIQLRPEMPVVPTQAK